MSTHHTFTREQIASITCSEVENKNNIRSAFKIEKAKNQKKNIQQTTMSQHRNRKYTTDRYRTVGWRFRLAECVHYDQGGEETV